MFIIASLGLTLVLTLLTACHEYAHYRVAVRHRIDVIKVSVGAGPTLWNRLDSNGTRWEIKLLPFFGGAYLAGTNATLARLHPPREGRRAFIYAPPLVRLRIALAGVVMNVAITWVAYTCAALLTTVPRTHRWWAWFASPLYGLQGIGRSIRFVLDRTWQWVNGTSVDATPSPTSSVTTFGEVQTTIAVVLFAVGATSLALAVVNVLPIWPLDGFTAVIACYDWARAWVAEGRYDLPRRPIPHPLTSAQQRWLALPSGLFAAAILAIPTIRSLLDFLT